MTFDGGALAAIGSLLIALIALVITNARAQRTETETAIENAATKESKARHDLAGIMTVQIGKLETSTQIQITKIESNIEKLFEETYRRTEARELEGRFGADLRRLETKMETMADKLSALAGMEALMRHMIERVDRVALKVGAD